MCKKTYLKDWPIVKYFKSSIEIKYKDTKAINCLMKETFFNWNDADIKVKYQKYQLKKSLLPIAVQQLT